MYSIASILHSIEDSQICFVSIVNLQVHSKQFFFKINPAKLQKLFTFIHFVYWDWQVPLPNDVFLLKQTLNFTKNPKPLVTYILLHTTKLSTVRVTQSKCDIHATLLIPISPDSWYHGCHL